MTVRRLAAGDEESLDAFIERGTASTTFLEDPRCLAWVVESEGVVVGWCWAHQLHRPDGRRDLLVYELEIEASARRRGHGRALLEAVLREAEEAGFGKVWLLTDTGNMAAQALYAAAGGQLHEQLLYSWPQGGRDASGSVAK